MNDGLSNKTGFRVRLASVIRRIWGRPRVDRSSYLLNKDLALLSKQTLRDIGFEAEAARRRKQRPF